MIILTARITPATAKNVEITPEIEVKNEIKPGERIRFNYSIISNKATNARIVPYVDCQSLPSLSLKELQINLNASQKYENEYESVKVANSTKPQSCLAQLLIKTPIEKKISKEFRVVNKPSFSFNILSCKKSSCYNQSNIFKKNEKIHLNYSSSVENPKISSTIIYPNGSKANLTVPLAIKAKKKGSYLLQATASKENYRTASDSIQFAVFNKSADIESMKPEIPGLVAKVCESKACEEEVESVEKGKKVWLDYSSDLESVSLTAKLVYPGGSSQEVELPKEVKLEQAGNYKLEVTASKQGYKETEDSYSFNVEEAGGKKKPGGGEREGNWLINNAPYLIFGVAIIVSIIIYLSLVPKK